MKVLLALTFLLLGLALGLAETDNQEGGEVERLGDSLARRKREPAGARRKKISKGRKKNPDGKTEGKGKKKAVRKKVKGQRRNDKKTKAVRGKGRKKDKARKKNKRRQGKGKKNIRKTKKKQKKYKKKKTNTIQRTTRTCSDSTSVSNECLENAAGVFKYLRSQVRTFNRKFARIQGFNKIIGNKLNKSGLFEETASYLLLALGGNLTSASCGETTRNRSQAVETYNLLNNCSAAIKEDCTLPDETLSDDDLSTFQNCSEKFQKMTNETDDCRKNYTSDGVAACNCWDGIVEDIDNVKAEKTCDANTVNAGVKDVKKTCLATFLGCRQAEDLAVHLVYTCGSGEVANNTKTTS